MSEKCPKCESGELYHADGGDGVEYEFWDCDQCEAEFYVPIEIVRDFANAEDQTPTDEPLNG